MDSSLPTDGGQNQNAAIDKPIEPLPVVSETPKQKNTFQLLAGIWKGSSKSQKIAVAGMLFLVLSMTVGVGTLRVQKLLRSKAAPITPPITPPTLPPTFTPYPTTTSTPKGTPAPTTTPTATPTPPPVKIQLLNNGSFEDDLDGNNVPDKWIYNRLTLSEGTRRICNLASDGFCSFRFGPGLTRRSLSQEVSFKAPLKTKFTLTYLVKGSNVGGVGKFDATISLYDKDGNKVGSASSRNKTGTYDFTSGAVIVSPGGELSSVKVTLQYDKQFGYAWFDDLELYAEVPPTPTPPPATPFPTQIPTPPPATPISGTPSPATPFP